MKKLFYILLLLLVILPSCKKLAVPEDTVIILEDAHAKVVGNSVTITGTFEYPGTVSDVTVYLNTSPTYSNSTPCSTSYIDNQIKATATGLNYGTYYYYVRFHNGYQYCRTVINRFSIE